MKVRKIGMFNQLFIMLAILLLAGNAVLGFFAYHRSEEALFEQIQSNAKNIAQCAAGSVSAELLSDMPAGSEGSENYNVIIDELALFRDNADIEYIYTLRQVGDGKVEFVVDSDLEEPAAIGDECDLTDAMTEAFANQITTTDDEPFVDEWGSHVSAYSPILYNDEMIGAIGVDISANWIDTQMENLRNLVVVICIVTYLISLIILKLLMLKSQNGIKKLNDKVKELAGGGGDLTKTIDIDTGDELEVIAGNMNEFIRQIRSLVSDVTRAADEIIKSGEMLDTTVCANNSVMENMNSEIEDISENMKHSVVSSKELSGSLAESAEHIAAFAKDVNDMSQMIEEANKNAQQASEVARENRENAMNTIHALQDKMEKISADAQKIEQVKQIAEQIGDISSQTSMLSLNAQIEAARAGSMGAGFAVVATEVGNLSNDIDRSVAEIDAINNQVLAAVGTLTDVLQEMIDYVSNDVLRDYDTFASQGEEYNRVTNAIRVQMEQVEMQSSQISQNISDINDDVDKIAVVVTAAAESSDDLMHATRQIAESFKDLGDVSAKNSRNAAALSEQMNQYTI